jgi:recombination protein RecT
MTETALVKKEIVDGVAARVGQFVQNNELNLPTDYSSGNALKSAWLMLQNTKDSNDKLVLDSCTKVSIANSLLDMVVQGLNPAKKQCYFIAYGTTLVCQRSYFGTMAVVKMVDPTILEIITEIVYEGDVFKYLINRGKKEVTKHEQALENVDKMKVKAAYCIIIDQDDKVRKTEVMSFDEIKQSWKQSKAHPVNDNGGLKTGTPHEKFTAEFCKRTIINRACKGIVNSSSDNQLLLKSFNRAGEVADEIGLEETISEDGNGDIIDVTPTPGAAPALPPGKTDQAPPEAPKDEAREAALAAVEAVKGKIGLPQAELLAAIKEKNPTAECLGDLDEGELWALAGHLHVIGEQQAAKKGGPSF